MIGGGWVGSGEEEGVRAQELVEAQGGEGRFSGYVEGRA